jgi:hypothetical protein
MNSPTGHLDYIRVSGAVPEVKVGAAARFASYEAGEQDVRVGNNMSDIGPARDIFERDYPLITNGRSSRKVLGHEWRRLRVLAQHSGRAG